MDETMLAPRTDAEYEVAIEKMLAELRRLNQQMREDQDEIDRLRAESRALKAETDAIKARIQARLDSLATMVAA